MRVLVDCDGVLADFVSGWLRLLNAQYAKNWTPEDVTSWDVCESLGLNNGQRGPARKLIASTPRFADKLEVYPGAVDGVARLRLLADVHIVTSPWNSHETWTYDREQWLRRHFDIRTDHITHTSAKHIVAGDVLIDDKTSTCDEWWAAHPTGVAVLWSTPHNRRDLWDGPCTNSWDEVVHLVRAAAGGDS